MYRIRPAPVLLPIKGTDPLKAEYAAHLPSLEGGAASVHPDPDTASLCRPAKKADTRQEFSRCGAPAEFPAAVFLDFHARSHRVFSVALPVFAVPGALVPARQALVSPVRECLVRAVPAPGLCGLSR